MAQDDLRRSHVGGGAGVMVSGLAWLIAAAVFLAAGPRPAFFTLFFCGLAITPIAQLVTRSIFKAPLPDAGKRLEWIAIATVPVLLSGFYFGWRALAEAPYTALPMVAIGVGLRYLAFPVMYGRAVFFGLGTAFIAAGAAGLMAPEQVALPASFGLALIELLVGALLVRQWQAQRVPG